MNETIRKTLRSRPITLAGPATAESIYTAETTTTIRLGTVVYEEASSADAGVAVRVGKIGSASYFSSYTTEVSRAAGSVSNLSFSALTLQGGETLTVECDGNKTGTGTISIQIETTHTIVI